MTTTTGNVNVRQGIDLAALEEFTEFAGANPAAVQFGFEEVIEAVLAALTGCINTSVSASALVRGIELAELTTRVSVAWDPFVFLHLSDPVHDGVATPQFRDLRVELTVAADGLTDEDLDYLRHSVNRSAVYNLVTTANPTSPSIRTR